MIKHIIQSLDGLSFKHYGAITYKKMFIQYYSYRYNSNKQNHKVHNIDIAFLIKTIQVNFCEKVVCQMKFTEKITVKGRKNVN